MSEKINIPKYLEERFGSLEPESDLIDGCKYLLRSANGWMFYMGFDDYAGCIPVRSKKEAIEYLKNTCDKVEEYVENGVYHFKIIQEGNK